jgi:hypothetical protein
MEPDQVTTPELDLSTLPAAGLEDRALGAGAAELAGQEPAPGAPQGGPPALTEEQKKLLEAQGFATLLVELGARAACGRWPAITIDGTEKQQTRELLAPILVKYDIRSAWLDKFKEEIALATFLAQLVMAKRAQVEAAKPAPKAKADDASSSSSESSAAVVTTALDGAVPDPQAFLRRS